MEDGRIPKDLLYGELTVGKRSQGRPHQCFRNVCKRDLRDCEIDVQEWEALVEDRDEWRCSVKTGVVNYENNRRYETEEKRQEGEDYRLSELSSAKQGLCLCFVWKGLPLMNWLVQPQQKVLIALLSYHTGFTFDLLLSLL